MRRDLKALALFLRRWLPVALWGGFVLYASTSVGSGNNTARFLKPILEWFHPDLFGVSFTDINYFTRKTAHVVQFIIYASLLWRGLSLPPPLQVGVRTMVAWVLGSAAFLGLLSEGIQLFSPLRKAMLTDVLLDITGAVVGVGVILAARQLAKMPVWKAWASRATAAE